MIRLLPKVEESGVTSIGIQHRFESGFGAYGSDNHGKRTPAAESVERYRCEGKLVALHQVIEFFLAIDRQEFGARVKESSR
jgi:hypothetical protein